MTKFNWRTCKRHEAEVIHDYFFEQWHVEEYQRERERDAYDAEEREERERYEHARDACDRHASDFADRHFGRM